MAMEISFSEKLSDMYEKASQASRVVGGLLPGGAFRFGNTDVRGIQQRVFVNLPTTLGEYYRQWFEKYADRVWLVYEGHRLTFRAARQQYLALGLALRGPAFNVKAGDRVGIAMRNYPEFLVSFIGITAVGAVAVPLNALWIADELEYAVTDAECKVLICDPDRLGRVAKFSANRGIKTILCRAAEGAQGGATATATWDEVMSIGTDAMDHVLASGGSLGKLEHSLLRDVKAEDEAMIMFTSGSTGKPKGVVHTQRSLGTAVKLAELAGVATGENDGASVQLMAVPLFHITALYGIGLLSIPNGIKIIMMRKWDAGAAVEIVEKEKVTRISGVPTMMRDLLEHPSFDPKRCSSLKSIIAGGAPVPPAQVETMRKKAKGVNSGQGYGMTESMGLGTINRGADYLKRPTSCGKPLPLMIDLKIVDPATGVKVKGGERGEVCIKGAMVMKCYNNLPEKTAESIDPEGYFHTGDIGKMEGGFVYILDRIKDLIIRGGENIDCSEVEAGLTANPAVRECSVFGLPDARLGEVVGAAIWKTDSSVSADDILATAATKLSKFKVPLPANVWILEGELPKGATGKIDKKGLRDLYSKEVLARKQTSSL